MTHQHTASDTKMVGSRETLEESAEDTLSLLPEGEAEEKERKVI